MMPSEYHEHCFGCLLWKNDAHYEYSDSSDDDDNKQAGNANPLSSSSQSIAIHHNRYPIYKYSDSEEDPPPPALPTKGHPVTGQYAKVFFPIESE